MAKFAKGDRVIIVRGARPVANLGLIGKTAVIECVVGGWSLAQKLNGLSYNIVLDDGQDQNGLEEDDMILTAEFDFARLVREHRQRRQQTERERARVRPVRKVS